MHKCENPKCFKLTKSLRFCSRACSHSAAPRRKRKCLDGVSVCSMRHCDCGGRKVAQCVLCGKPRSKDSNRYCASKKCSGAGSYGSPELVAAWLRGEINADIRNKKGEHRKGLANWARTYLLEEAEHKCTKCGWCEPHPLTGKPPLEVDHIDGDRRNNKRENLIVLCPNCHALTPTYRRYNYRLVQELKKTTWTVQSGSLV